MKKRIFSALLALILCFGAVTVTAHAADEPAAQSVQTETAEAPLSETQSKTLGFDAGPGWCGWDLFNQQQDMLLQLLRNPIMKALLLSVMVMGCFEELVKCIAQGGSILEIVQDFFDTLWLLFKL